MNKPVFYFAACFVSVVLLTACGGQSQQPAAEPVGAVYVSAVQPLNNPDLLTLAAPDGRTACGVFDLATSNPPTGWGFKTADLTLWPACQSQAASLEILCLNGEAQWVTPTFEGLTLDPTGSELSWTSQQEGICGFFAK